VNRKLQVNVIKHYEIKKGIDFAHDARATAQGNQIARAIVCRGENSQLSRRTRGAAGCDLTRMNVMMPEIPSYEGQIDAAPFSDS
jgi:hypothetical protein